MGLSTKFLTVLVVASCGFSTNAQITATITNDKSEIHVDVPRELRVFDKLFSTDLCENAPHQYGPCDASRFPVCVSGQTLICYNRRPRRDLFYSDTSPRQPYYYIDYNSVFCYPDTWGGCSSCSPGRYCLSELRCILDETNYPCSQWL